MFNASQSKFNSQLHNAGRVVLSVTDSGFKFSATIDGEAVECKFDDHELFVLVWNRLVELEEQVDVMLSSTVHFCNEEQPEAPQWVLDICSYLSN